LEIYLTRENFSLKGVEMSRLSILKIYTLTFIFVILSYSTFCQAKQSPDKSKNTLSKSQIVLYHVHVTGGFNVDSAVALSKEMGIKFGLVDNFGRHYWNYSNEHLKQYLKRMKGKGAYIGIQAEGRDWMRVFSKKLLSELDFILADGMTFPNTNGTYSRLWVNQEVRIRNVDFFMDRYTDYLADIASEPIDIIANVTFLPEVISADYDKLWTDERVIKLINACVKNDVAIEINARYRIPSPKILKMAKKAGVKFAFGANSHSRNQAKQMDYCLEMIKELGLTEKDMFKPSSRKK
jgi:histidinol phosphatase-like PHP family hydrolase